MEKNVLSEKLYQDLVDTARTYGIDTALGPVLQAIPERFLEEAQVTWRARLPATTPYDAFIEAVAQLAASQRRDLLHLVNILAGGKVREYVEFLAENQNFEQAAAIMRGLAIPYGTPRDMLALIKFLIILERREAQTLLAQGVAKKIVRIAQNASPETLPGLLFLDDKPAAKDDLCLKLYDENGVEMFRRSIQQAPQRLFCAALKDVVVDNADYVLLPDGRCLFDGMTYKKNYEWQRPYIYQEEQTVLASQGDGFVTEMAPTLFLGRTAEHGHFIIDAIDRLYSYAQAGAPPVEKVLVQQRPRPGYREFLAAMGLPAAPEAYVTVAQATKFRQLIVPSLGTRLPAVHPKSIRFLQAQAARVARRLSPVRAARVYLARKPDRRRNLKNLAFIETLLDQAGFVKIFPEDLTFLEQIAVMRQAEVIVGVHGSALFNAIWAPPGTRVGVFVPHSWHSWHPAQLEMLFDILRAVGHQAAAIFGLVDAVTKKQHQDFIADFELSPTALARWIDDIDTATSV